MKNTDCHTPTDAQIDANRRNALKSTGPRTAEGKNASSRNRLLHGLRANKHILLDEDPADFLLLVQDHLDRFHPIGPSEEKLVLRIAADQWRLTRTVPMEAGIYRDRFQDVAQKDEERQRIYDTKKRWAEEESKPVPPPPTPRDEGDLLARAFNVDCDGPNSFAKLSRYKGSTERSIDRCLRQLQKYQAARLIQPTPPPDEPLIPEASTPGPAATPSKSENYHSNPKTGKIAPNSAAALLLVLSAFLRAVPEIIVALASSIGLPHLQSPRNPHNPPNLDRVCRDATISERQTLLMHTHRNLHPRALLANQR